MSEMTERVAKAMAVVANGGEWDNPQHYTDDQKKVWLVRARAVIAAMRELPSEPGESLHCWSLFPSQPRSNGG